MSIKFELNGTRTSLEQPPHTALLWVLREHLKLTGTKFGCGSGLCGACTVHLDGQPMRACLSIFRMSERITITSKVETLVHLKETKFFLSPY